MSDRPIPILAPRTPHRCPICGGRGTVPAGFYTRLGHATTTGYVKCRACGGCGVIVA